MRRHLTGFIATTILLLIVILFFSYEEEKQTRRNLSPVFTKRDYIPKNSKNKRLSLTDASLEQQSSKRQGKTIHFVVDKDTGEPISEADVWIIFYSPSDEKIYRLKSGKDGKVLLPQASAEQPYKIHILHPDYTPLYKEKRGKMERFFRMSKGARIVGCAMDSSGSILPLQEADMGSANPAKIIDRWFEFNSLKPGRYRIYVHPVGYYRKSLFVEVRQGETKKVKVLFDDKENIRISGVVYNEKRLPLHRVRIRYPGGPVVDEDGWYRGMLLAETDFDGRFSFYIPRKKWSELKFRFEKENYPYAWQLNVPQNGEPFEILMSETTATLKGNIKVNGKPYNGFLFINGEGLSPLGVRTRSILWGVRIISVKNGKFSIDNLPPAVIQIHFCIKGYVGKTVSINLKDGVEKINLSFNDKGGVIEGYVFDETGAPAPDATVFCRPVNPSSPHMYVPFVGTDSNGFFRIEGLPGGEYIVLSRTPNTRAIKVFVNENGTVKNILLLPK